MLKMEFSLKFIFLMLIVTVGTSNTRHKLKTVTTLLNTKWEVTPLVLEASEYLAEENIDHYWSFIDDVSNLKEPLVDLISEKVQYDKIIEICDIYLTPSQTRMLKLALSLHIYSPKIEMYEQIATVRGVSQTRCPAVIDYNGKLYCNLKEFHSQFKSSDNVISNIGTYKIDHHYPGSENKSRVIILYGELGTPEFSEMHFVLKDLARHSLINYIYRPYVKERQNRKVRLSGYGVELQMKSTEYKVMDDTEVKLNDTSDSNESDELEDEVSGFNFQVLKSLYQDKKHDLEKFRNHLLESTNEMAPLKVWQVQHLSLQTAEKILSASGEEALSVLTHISHNFPTQARSLIKVPVRDELKNEIKRNQELFSSVLNLSPSDAAIFINGMFFDLDIVDVISLLEVLRQELRVMDGLHKIGINEDKLNSLLSLDLSPSTTEYAVDIRDSAVLWINDIEKDQQYRKWSSSLLDLLRPTFPGMLRSVRRNLYNLVLIVDPSQPESRSLIKLAESFYVHTSPLHIGIVFSVSADKSRNGLNDASIAVLNSFNYISEAKNAYAGLSFITDVYASVDEKEVLTPQDVHNKLKQKYRDIDINDVFGDDTSYDSGKTLSAEFVQRSGFRKLPQALLNGIPLPEKSLSTDEFEESVLSEIMNQTPQLQKAVYRGDLSDSDDTIDYLMNRPNVMPRLNERVLSENHNYLDLTGTASEVLSVENFDSLLSLDKTATLLTNMKYFTGRLTNNMKPAVITHWIVCDLEKVQGRLLLKYSLEQMKSSASIRVSVILNSQTQDTEQLSPLTKLILAAVEVLPSDVATNYVLKILENEQVFETLTGFNNLPNFNIPGFNSKILTVALNDNSAFHTLHKIHDNFVEFVLKFDRGANGVVTNGRVFGPFADDEIFIADDFALLERYCFNQYGDKILEVLKDKTTTSNSVTEELDGEGGTGDKSVTSNTIMQTVSILSSRVLTRTRFSIPVKDTDSQLSVVDLPPLDPTSPAFDLVVIVDPASRGAMKVGPLVSVLYRVVNSRVRLFLNCIEKNSDLPLKSFYRYVLEPELSFQADGRASPGPIAKFTNLPTSVLFTQAMHVAENWLVESVKSPYDLDNIKLDDVLENNVHSEFELEYLLLEGHCFEAALGNPPRGLQITLGIEKNLVMQDTIVMANLGYFQLKANPGAWILRLREGRSSDIYNIVSHEGSDTPVNSSDIQIIISSFRSHVLKLKVQKKPDKLKMDLLSDESEPGAGIWNSITSSFGTKADDEKDDVINIFSLASGHLYERFIKIMMLSVLKHTNTSVKFWFLKNYLSPTLKDFLPHMAKEYNFEYELVQYKWPRWLHQQTEKQRIIWGYKILFLDVLFPLQVKKIIFVDADQVVRADMKELRDLDLGGAPYAYTPFCDSRKEMDGFRFWKQGYWRQHLQGRRYHISALYVVDLKRFRRIAAGDRLRGQYQALSQDPNSLSNLDQDLPNNMIHQVAIKSLPQEWLWCETWCSDESKPYAKTIDLCNNPQTKEAKLTAAMRIVSEWKDYDSEIKQLLRKVDIASHIEEVTETNKEKHFVHSEL